MPPVVLGHLDYYAVLEIAPSADLSEVNAAFRRLAWRYHPDRNPAPGATLQFQDINGAHQVLSDPVRRAEYDAQWHPETQNRYEAPREPSRPRIHRRWRRNRPARSVFVAVFAVLLVAGAWVTIFVAMDSAHSNSLDYGFEASSTRVYAASPDCSFSMELSPVTYIDEHGQPVTAWETNVRDCWGGSTRVSSIPDVRQYRASRDLGNSSYR